MNDREEGKGMRLLRKGKRGLIQAIFSRLGLIVLLFCCSWRFCWGCSARQRSFCRTFSAERLCSTPSLSFICSTVKATRPRS